MRKVPEDENNNSNQAKQLAKEGAKYGAKIVLKNLIRIALPYIIIVVVAIIVFAILIGVANTIQGTIKDIGNSIVSFFTGENTSFKINDEQLDELIEAIEATGVDLEDLELLRRH